MTAATPPSPAASARFLAISGAIAAALIGALAWSLWDEDDAPRSVPGAALVEPTPAPAITPVAPPVRPHAPARARPLAVEPPQRLPELTRLSLGALQADGRLTQTSLAGALGRRVALVNIWATYCAPCMRELPRLLELLAEPGWGSDLRFVPILLEPPDPTNAPQTAALASLRAAPGVRHTLVDLTPAGLVQTVLHADGLLPDRATLPLSVLLDCEQRVRWVHIGEITDPAPLRRLIEQLRGELARCAPEPTAPPEPVVGCGDHVCDPRLGEDCMRCPADCGCPADRICARTPGGSARCNITSQGLKN